MAEGSHERYIPFHRNNDGEIVADMGSMSFDGYASSSLCREQGN